MDDAVIKTFLPCQWQSLFFGIPHHRCLILSDDMGQPAAMFGNIRMGYRFVLVNFRNCVRMFRFTDNHQQQYEPHFSEKKTVCRIRNTANVALLQKKQNETYWYHKPNCKRTAASRTGCGKILYGSEARGDALPDSDIDLLILIDGDKISIAQEEEITTPLYQIELETGVPIHPIVMLKKNWFHRPFNTPFYINVMNEGIAL